MIEKPQVDASDEKADHGYPIPVNIISRCISVDKQSYIKPLFEPLSDAGFAWFTINYRLAPQHRWPACAEDVEAAVRWVKAHAAEYKVPARVKYTYLGLYFGLNLGLTLFNKAILGKVCRFADHSTIC